MIFANHWVAKKIAEAFPSAALVRCYPCLINLARGLTFESCVKDTFVVVHQQEFNWFF